METYRYEQKYCSTQEEKPSTRIRTLKPISPESHPQEIVKTTQTVSPQRTKAKVNYHDFFSTESTCRIERSIEVDRLPTPMYISYPLDNP